MLTRPEFERACKLLVEASEKTGALKGWHWHEHPSVSGLGYLSRTSSYLGKPTESENLDADEQTEIDEAAGPSVDYHILTSQQYVVYSPTFRVPCFYFTMYHSNGAPLTLTELLSTSLLRRSIVEDAETTRFALTRQEAMFPLLSQGDHPTTGKPCWYLHPCETTVAVEELLKEIEDENESEDEGLLKCLKIWFLVVEGAVKLSSEHGFHM